MAGEGSGGGGGAGAFEDEAEPTVTIGEYIEGIEAEELVKKKNRAPKTLAS